jgi:hypothetical protein
MVKPPPDRDRVLEHALPLALEAARDGVSVGEGLAGEEPGPESIRPSANSTIARSRRSLMDNAAQISEPLTHSLPLRKSATSSTCSGVTLEMVTLSARSAVASIRMESLP